MTELLLASPHLLALCGLAVVLVGLSKGGLGGMSLMGVPLLAPAMPPMTAAALLLPILVAMDAVSVVTWRKHVDGQILRLVLPPAMLGIGFGWLTAEVVSDAMVRLIVGAVSLAFVARVLWARWGQRCHPSGPRRWFGRVCGRLRATRALWPMPARRPCRYIFCRSALTRSFLPEHRCFSLR